MLLPLFGLVLAAGTDPIPALHLAQDAGIWDRLKLDASARLRGESIFDHPITGNDRHGGRFRFRAGATYDVTSTVRAGIRLTTLSDGRDPNNPHWHFGDGVDGFSAAEIGIDRLYVEWRALREFTLTGGKFAHVFTRPAFASEFAWDDDLQPAGVAAVYKPESSGRFAFDARTIFVVAEERPADEDPTMFGVQANARYKASDRLALHLATSISDWSSVDPGTIVGNQGNTADAGGFSILDTWLQATWNGGFLREGAAFVQHLLNVDDDSGDDTGLVAGLRFGPARAKGDWSVFVAWYDMETNAVYSPVAQNDTPVAGTGLGNGEGMTGFLGGVHHLLEENLSVRLWALTSDVGEAHDPVRVRLDFDFRIL